MSFAADDWEELGVLDKTSSNEDKNYLVEKKSSDSSGMGSFVDASKEMDSDETMNTDKVQETTSRIIDKSDDSNEVLIDEKSDMLVDVDEASLNSNKFHEENVLNNDSNNKNEISNESDETTGGDSEERGSSCIDQGNSVIEYNHTVVHDIPQTTSTESSQIISIDKTADKDGNSNVQDKRVLFEVEENLSTLEPSIKPSSSNITTSSQVTARMNNISQTHKQKLSFDPLLEETEIQDQKDPNVDLSAAESRYRISRLAFQTAATSFGIAVPENVKNTPNEKQFESVVTNVSEDGPSPSIEQNKSNSSSLQGKTGLLISAEASPLATETNVLDVLVSMKSEETGNEDKSASTKSMEFEMKNFYNWANSYNLDQKLSVATSDLESRYVSMNSPGTSVSSYASTQNMSSYPLIQTPNTKPFNPLRFICVGLISLSFGLIGSYVAQSSCHFATIIDVVGYYENQFEVYVGMREYTPIDSVFQGHSFCMAYDGEDSFSIPNMYVSLISILALVAGSVSLVIVWVFLLFVRTTPYYWNIGKKMAMVAAFGQVTTLGFFFSGPCNQYSCHLGPGSVASILALCSWILLAWEMHANCPLSASITIDNRTFLEKFADKFRLRSEFEKLGWVEKRIDTSSQGSSMYRAPDGLV